MAAKKALFGGPMKKVASNVKSSTSKGSSAKSGSAKPMKDCGCGGHGKR